MLEDTWFLGISINIIEDPATTSRANVAGPSKSSKAPKVSKSSILPITLKWEKRKRPSTAFSPPLRSGCTMTLWGTRNLGIMFGGVTDEDTGEETMESVFWNDLYAYQLGNAKGRWSSLLLRKPKQKSGGEKIKAPAKNKPYFDEGEVVDSTEPSADLNDPSLTIPIPRYNAMLAVLRNILYIYGGIFERGSKEYTLDDYYALQLDKMDRFVCLKSSDVLIPDKDANESSSSEEGDDDDTEESSDQDDESDIETEASTAVDPEDEMSKESAFVTIFEGEEYEEEEPQDLLREQAAAFMGVSKDTARSEEDIISTPFPGETLTQFFSRSREYWTQKARERSDDKGKMLRKVGFALAEERYNAYKPILEEVERILAEAGLDEEEMKRVGSGGGDSQGQSRNRR